MKTLILMAALLLLVGFTIPSTMQSTLDDTLDADLLIEDDETTQIQDCIKSTFGEYFYQGDMDPQIVTRDWIVLEDKTRPYGPGAIEVYYRNPDMPCDIPIAVFLVYQGAYLSFAYLQNGEVHLYALDLESKCYRGDILKGYARHSFKARLGEALGLRSL